MKTCNATAAIIVTAAMLFAGAASAQKKPRATPAPASKVTPAPVFYDASVQFSLPDDDITSVELPGMKNARIAWLTFVKFADGATSNDQQVITLMEGTKAKWAGPKSCSYELTLSASPPTIAMNKNPKLCAMRRGETAVFRVLAM